MNGANAYTGGNYRNTALEEVPFYADTSANQQDSDGDNVTYEVIYYITIED